MIVEFVVGSERSLAHPAADILDRGDVSISVLHSFWVRIPVGVIALKKLMFIALFVGSLLCPVGSVLSFVEALFIGVVARIIVMI